MGPEHVFGVESVDAIHPDISQGSNSLDPELPGTGSIDRWHTTPEPPVPTVEQLLVIVGPRPAAS